jgi:hypothetical protein
MRHGVSGSLHLCLNLTGCAARVDGREEGVEIESHGGGQGVERMVQWVV